MKKSIIIIILNTIILTLLMELFCYAILKSKGIPTKFLFSPIARIKGFREAKFWTVDPHLGYAYDEGGEHLNRLNNNFSWRSGFVIYRKEVVDIRQLEKPVVLALGGSTTDGIAYGYSWPEALAELLRENKLSGTVINGGTGGYSTSQELLKLLRDGLEFKPDIVISYSGVNDRGFYNQLPYPLVHSYQSTLLDTLVRRQQPPLFPSIIRAVFHFTGADKRSKMNYTLGVPTVRTLAEQYEFNMRSMEAISSANGAQFLGFIQPCGYLKSGDGEEPGHESARKYQEAIVSLYSEITKLPSRLEYLRDATSILDDRMDVYKPDQVHLVEAGDRLVAAHVLREILPLLNGK